MRAAHELFDTPYLANMDVKWTEDNVMDVIEWVVSQDKDYYCAVLSDPTRMSLEFVHPTSSGTFSGLAPALFLDRFGELIPEPGWSSWARQEFRC